MRSRAPSLPRLATSWSSINCKLALRRPLSLSLSLRVVRGREWRRRGGGWWRGDGGSEWQNLVALSMALGMAIAYGHPTSRCARVVVRLRV